jgi:hypothetical protein
MLQPGGDLRTVMMSSSVHQNRAHQRRLGISASLVKPVKAADLLSVIKTVLSTEASLSPGRARLRSRPKPLRCSSPKTAPSIRS